VNYFSGCSKWSLFLPAQPWRLFHPPALSLPRQTLRPGTRLGPCKAAANYPFLRGGWDDPNCAQLSHPPTHWHAETYPQPERGPSLSLYLPLEEWPRLPSTARIERGPADSPTSPEGVGRLFFTARIERPPFHRGGSASKKNGLPAPSLSSEAARCASKGIVPTTPLPFQHPDYSTLYPLAAKQVPRIALMPDIPCSARA
jgi:hypothetical protein